MGDEDGFLNAIRATPADGAVRLVYADWLDDHGDPRGAFVRLELALRSAGPDHAARPAAEVELSRLRRAADPDWLAVIEPPPSRPPGRTDAEWWCDCFRRIDWGRGWKETSFHTEPQDTGCTAWEKLCELIDTAAADGRGTLLVGKELGDAWPRMVTLPPTIGRLGAVEFLDLSGNHLVRLPPEVGGMESLRAITVNRYSSSGLHWFPFEITRCRRLIVSGVSESALYGNARDRTPFPALRPGPITLRPGDPVPVRNCSVCDRPFEDFQRHRVWVSLQVATDVLPLLVNACSAECVGRLPAPPDGYVPTPHRGGPNVQQPPRR